MKTRRLWVSLFVLSAALISTADKSLATNISGIPGKTIEERIAELEKEVQTLKRLKEVDQEVQAKKELETPVVVAGKDGFSIRSKDQDFQLKFRGQVQVDGRYFARDNTPGGTNTYTLRRVRPTLEGTVFKYFDFRLMPDFGSGTTVLQDAYIDFKYWQQASLRAGKFKSPVGLERLQQDPNKLWVEDSLTSNLVPNRDIGIDLHGELLEGALNYDLGVFNGTPDGSNLTDSDNHDDKDLAARIFVQPFKNSTNDALNGIGLGLGGSIGRAHGTTTTTNLNPGFKTAGQQTFFSYLANTFANGKRFRIAPQGYYYYGPFGVLGEVVLSQNGVRQGNNTAQLNNSAWQIAGSYVLTGENATYSGLVPRTNFDPSKRTWGAFEVVSRLNWLNIDRDAFPLYASGTASAKKAKAVGVGLNWYLNKYLKVMTDFESTFFDGGFATGNKDRRTELTFLNRLQIAF